MYKIICREEVQGSGDVSWSGNTGYLFDDLEEAKEFIESRLSALGEQNEIFQLLDNNEIPTGQFLVTLSIESVEKVE